MNKLDCALCVCTATHSFPASIKSKWLIPLLCLWTLLSPCIKTSPPQRVSATGPHIKHVTTPHHMYVPVCCPGDRWQIEMKAGRSCTLFKCYSTSTWIQIPPMLTCWHHADMLRLLVVCFKPMKSFMNKVILVILLKRVSLFDYRGTPLMLSQIWCFQFLSPNTCLWPSCLHVVLWKGHWVNLQRTRASVTASEAFFKPQPQFMLNHILSARNSVKP